MKAKGKKAIEIAIVSDMGIDLSHVAMAAEAIQGRMAQYPEGTRFTAAVRDFDGLATEIAIAAGITRVTHVEPTDWEAHKRFSEKAGREVNLGAIESAAQLAARKETRMVAIVQPRPAVGDKVFQNRALLNAALNGTEIVLVRPEVKKETA